MRNLPLLLALLLLAALGLAAAAQASPLPLPDQVRPLLEEEVESEELEDGEAELDEEICVTEEERAEEFCEEEAEEGEECAVEDATAKLTAKPGADSFGLTIRYRASAPTAVTIDARLRGGKGGVHLGASRARFRRSGTFRDSFSLSEKEMERALTAREFLVEVRAVNSPRYCRIDLSGGLRLARR